MRAKAASQAKDILAREWQEANIRKERAAAEAALQKASSDDTTKEQRRKGWKSGGDAQGSRSRRQSGK